MSYVRVLNKRIPLDNTYENVITFKDLYNANGVLVQSHMTKEAFFKSYDTYYNNTYYYIKVNFKYGDTLYTELRLRTADIGSSVISGLNYVHVKNTDNPRYPEDLYYFITDILYLSGDIVSLKLELDVYTTYFDYTGFKGEGVIFTKRCHCDRFSNYNDAFGCEEALLPDTIDNLYSATILKSHSSMFANYKYLILYLSNNTPKIKYEYKTSSSDYTIKHDAGGKIRKMAFATWNSNPYSTKVNNYPAPYIVAVIPINTTNLTATGTGFDAIGYGLNTGYPTQSEDEDSYYTLFANSPYVLAMQFSNFDFSSYTTLKEGMYLCDLQAHGTTDENTYFYRPAVMINEINSLSQNASFLNTQLYRNVGISSTFTKSYMTSLTKREIGLEPKLYTAPYTRFTYTSASDKEYAFEPILTGKYSLYSYFKRIFTPTPTSNGEMCFITSEPYNNYEANYMGSSPVQNNELPIANDNLQTFLTGQKNSYYTGVGMSMVNALFSIPTNPTGGVVSAVGEGVSLASKMSDLRSQPNKLGGTNFDIYSIISCTDTNKYINVWSLIDKELKKVADYYYMNGYEVDMFRDCSMIGKDLYCSKESIVTRKLFDFVQLGEEIINNLYYDKNEEPLSQAVRDKFNQTFTQGVRLWFITSASDYKNFTLENKEIN